MERRKIVTIPQKLDAAFCQYGCAQVPTAKNGYPASGQKPFSSSTKMYRHRREALAMRKYTLPPLIDGYGSLEGFI